MQHIIVQNARFHFYVKFNFHNIPLPFRRRQRFFLSSRPAAFSTDNRGKAPTSQVLLHERNQFPINPFSLILLYRNSFKAQESVKYINLFVSQCFYRTQLCRFSCRVNSKEQTDCGRKERRTDNGRYMRLRRNVQNRADRIAAQHSKYDADNSA